MNYFCEDTSFSWGDGMGSACWCVNQCRALLGWIASLWSTKSPVAAFARSKVLGLGFGADQTKEQVLPGTVECWWWHFFTTKFHLYCISDEKTSPDTSDNWRWCIYLNKHNPGIHATLEAKNWWAKPLMVGSLWLNSSPQSYCARFLHASPPVFTKLIKTQDGMSTPQWIPQKMPSRWEYTWRGGYIPREWWGVIDLTCVSRSHCKGGSQEWRV